MNYTLTDLICSTCGYIQTIQRKKSNQKKELHIKDLYCPMCKKNTKFIELVDKDKFYNKLIRKNTLTDLEKLVLDLIEEGNKSNEKQYRYNR